MNNPNKPIHCACGLIMRQHKWSDHWRSCRYAQARDADAREIEELEKHEARMERIHAAEAAG